MSCLYPYRQLEQIIKLIINYTCRLCRNKKQPEAEPLCHYAILREIALNMRFFQFEAVFQSLRCRGDAGYSEADWFESMTLCTVCIFKLSGQMICIGTKKVIL